MVTIYATPFLILTAPRGAGASCFDDVMKLLFHRVALYAILSTLNIGENPIRCFANS